MMMPTRREIADVQDEYERKCESLWDDTVLEFAMKYGLDEEEARDLLEGGNA
jgi:hypothetical protein